MILSIATGVLILMLAPDSLLPKRLMVRINSSGVSKNWQVLHVLLNGFHEKKKDGFDEVTKMIIITTYEIGV